MDENFPSKPLVILNPVRRNAKAELAEDPKADASWH
jgi:hypothetical protein